MLTIFFRPQCTNDWHTTFGVTQYTVQQCDDFIKCSVHNEGLPSQHVSYSFCWWKYIRNRFNIKTAFPGVWILIIKIRQPAYMYLDNMNPHIMGNLYWWDTMFIRNRRPEYNSKSWSPFDAVTNTCDLGIINLIIISCSLLFTEHDTYHRSCRDLTSFVVSYIKEIKWVNGMCTLFRHVFGIVCYQGPLLLTWIDFDPILIINCTRYTQVWDEIIHPFSNFVEIDK